MTRIVHFGKYYAPDLGGIESATETLATHCARAGYDVSVVCFQKAAPDLEQTLNGVEVYRAPISLSASSQPFSWRYIQLCLEHGRQADIVHVHTPNMLGALSALLLGRKPKVVVHWHSDVIGKGLLGRLLQPLETALLTRADAIVATSERYAEGSAPLRRFRNKISIAPLGIADPHLKDALSDRISLPDDRKVILAVGRLVPYKGFNVLVEAARRLADDSLVVIAGEGPSAPELADAIKTFGVEDRVMMTGRISADALQDLFRRATMFCLPSVKRSEAFGVVLIEAMAFRLPIVATEIPGSGVPWVNCDGVTGLNVPLGDPIALADACNAILGSPKDRARFSEGSRQRFLTEFTDELFVSRVVQVYADALSRD